MTDLAPVGNTPLVRLRRMRDAEARGLLADGTRKSVGVILPSKLTFNTGDPERMEIIAGSCRYKLAGGADWITVKAGGSFEVPGKSSFDIEQSEPLHYVCHFG